MAAPTNLHRDLGRMEGKLDAVLSEMRSGLREAHSRLDDHEKRLRHQEDRETQQTGAIKAARWLWGVLTAAFGLLGGITGAQLWPK